MNTKELADYVLEIQNFTNYKTIEIEQVNSRMNNIHGALVLRYKKKYNDEDPENVVVDGIHGEKIDGGPIKFVKNPYPGARKPIGTGRVTYLIDDQLSPDEKDFPKGFLSGAEKGRNLEFLASLYGEGLFKIVDPEWEKIVRERHEAMMEAKKMIILNHKFDKKYTVKGMGTDEDMRRISVEPSPEVASALESMQHIVKEQAKEIEKLKKKSSKKSLLPSFQKPQVEEKKVEPEKTVENFAK